MVRLFLIPGRFIISDRKLISGVLHVLPVGSASFLIGKTDRLAGIGRGSAGSE